MPLSREGWVFEELDGARHINFMPADKLIQVTSDVSGSASLDVPANSVEIGLHAFLSKFARDVREWIPDAFEWKDLSELRRFA